MIGQLLVLTAGIIWGIETIPQIVKLLKTKKTAGISLWYFSLCCLAYTLFITGSILLKSYPVAIAHIFPFMANLTIALLVIKYRRI
ncbi:MAG: PQ-loop domain-containing transporter [Candidatus Hodarchaeota archaeon]